MKSGTQKLKKFLAFVMTAVMMLTAVPLGGLTFSASAENDGYYTYTVENGEATITDCDETISGDVVIPDTLGGYPVTRIGSDAFKYCSGLTSVTIGDSVKSIGNYAFYGCNKLRSITIPDSVTSIGGSAFSYCTGLTSLTIGNSVTSIGGSAFSYCTGLTSITIPDSVTSIGYSAFAYCTGLTSITVSSGNTVYHSTDNCLIETESKTLILGCKNSIIPSDGSVTSIGDCAFSRCISLTSITIPDSVTSIGKYAFSDCTGLTSITVSTGNTVYHSTDNCLIETESKTLILGCKNSIIPSDGSVTRIGDDAFSDCTGLTSITIPDGVTSIGDCTFYGCTGLTSVTIPDSVTSIGVGAFEYCTGLTSVTIPDSVTSIGGKAFSGCTGLTSITIPDSVTSIGVYAFSSCSGLTSVTIGNSVTSIGEEAFAHCTGLKSITIPDSVTSIGEYAFYDCTGLTSITIPSSVTDIGHRAFGYFYLRGKYVKVDNFTIYGYTGTAAETYANKNGFAFIALGGEHTHTYSAWVVTTEPTCTALGEETRTCSVCGATETRTIEKAAHKIVIDTSVTPTCTETGVTEGQHCSVCGEVLVEQQTIAAAGHNDDNSDGICDSCGEDLGTHTPSENCSCGCHKGGIAKLFFKIKLFFQKIFKKNKVCSCGVNHY